MLLARLECFARPLVAALWLLTSGGLLKSARGQEAAGFTEADVFLGGRAFSANESSNLGNIYKWLDDLMWTDLWDSGKNRDLAYSQLLQLADLASEPLPSMAYGVGQALYSYFWFKDNGGELNIPAAVRSIELHEVSLKYSGCTDLTMGVGTFLSKVCAERWIYLIMLCAEVGTELATRRSDVGQAGRMLQKANELFLEVNEYPFFSFRGWRSVYDINTNSHLFSGPVRQRPIWPKEGFAIAEWLEANFQVFRDDLDFILQNDLFDTLYFAGHVSMTQFSGKRESWAPLNLIHNRVLAPHACQAANRSCELLQSRPEIARCHAADVGAAIARLQPGMGIKPHFWTAPPRLAVHLGLIVPPGASMAVGDQAVEWEEGKAVVFDDTYIHSVRHTGTEVRYLLIAWFCHPCDDLHAEQQQEDTHGLCSQ